MSGQLDILGGNDWSVRRLCVSGAGFNSTVFGRDSENDTDESRESRPTSFTAGQDPAISFCDPQR